MEKYEPYLGNKHLLSEGLPPRVEITGISITTRRCTIPRSKEYEIGLDPIYTDPTNKEMDRPHFLYVGRPRKLAKIDKADVERATMFVPSHSAIFATYFTITGLHGLHVLGGVIVLFTCCSSAANYTAKTRNTSQIELRWRGCSGTLSIWFGSLFSRSFTCSNR
jgi:hypothetical protein